MENNTDWVETPKLRPKLYTIEKRNAVSVPTTPVLKSSNHFQVLSPPSSSRSKKKKKKPPHPTKPTEQVVPSLVQEEQQPKSLHQISFFDYLRDELTVTDFNSVQELKKERITNFLGVPAAIERVKQKT